MSTIQIIENKIAYIKKCLISIREYQDSNLEEFEKNKMLRGVVERELYVIAQAVIDLAEAIVAYKNLRKPTTMRESFDILGEANILPKDFLVDFSKIVGFRNALAHDYQDLKIETTYDVLKNKLKQVEEFLSYIQKVSS